MSPSFIGTQPAVYEREEQAIVPLQGEVDDGFALVNALSESMTASVRRGGSEYRQSYRRGKPASKLRKGKKARVIGAKVSDKSGPFGLWPSDHGQVAAGLQFE